MIEKLGATTTNGSNVLRWAETLEACGLHVLDNGVPATAPSVLAAIQAVTGIDVEPTVAVRESLTDAMGELDRQWHTQISRSPQTSDNDEFFILPPVKGGSKIGWVRVKDSGGTNLPSRIAAATGSPEFLTLSTDGHNLFAISVEDDEYWIVVHKFK
ncbi:hypothetical protein ACFXKX_16165 [Streptomyces scopuliridis]|uniref:hypothetical protein n=1 Tax=Streptomyces scopuliridis TaxID=452529 RepID=UPI0036AA7EA1